MAEPGAPFEVDVSKIIRDLNVREKEVISRKDDLLERESRLEKRLTHQKRAIEEKEKEFYSFMEERSQFLDAREKELIERQEAAQLKYHDDMKKAQFANGRLTAELTIKESQLNELLREAEAERAKYTEESRNAIQSNSRKFVVSALETLGAKENKFHFISGVWAVIGAGSLFFGVVFAICTMIYSADSYHQSGNTGLGYYLFSLFRGLIVVGVFGLLSRYAFIFSNSYMHESLKVGERVHAIKFGEFYLDTYGSEAKWDQVKEAFAQWNISGQSAFSKQDSGSPDFSAAGSIVQAAEKAIDAASKLTKKD